MKDFKEFNHKHKDYLQHNVQLRGGHETISVLTPEGKQITFAFLPSFKLGDADQSGKPCPSSAEPMAVDIVYHHDGEMKSNGAFAAPVQNVRVLGMGPTYYNSESTEDKPTIVSILFTPPERGE